MLKKLSSSMFPSHSFSVAVGQYLRNANEAVQILGLVSVLVVYWMFFGYEGVEILGALALFQRVGASAAQLSGDLNKFQSLVPYLRNFEIDLPFSVMPTEGGARNLSIKVESKVKVIEVRQVRFLHRSGRGLEGCCFQMAVGQVTLIKGASGSGKSTLIDCLLGLLDFQSGSIHFDSQRMLPDDLRQYRRYMAMVDQFPYFGGGHFFSMLLSDSPCKVKVFVSTLRAFGMVGLADSVLQDGLGALKNADTDMSGGEKQRLAIALALAVATDDRKLIIFDEPTAALDSENAAVFRKLITEVKDEMIVLIVSHDPVMIDWADNVVDLQSQSGVYTKCVT